MTIPSRNHVKPGTMAGGAEAERIWNAWIDKSEAGPCPGCGIKPMGERKLGGVCEACAFNYYVLGITPPFKPEW
jgi:hypothetical protein